MSPLFVDDIALAPVFPHGNLSASVPFIEPADNLARIAVEYAFDRRRVKSSLASRQVSSIGQGDSVRIAL